MSRGQMEAALSSTLRHVVLPPPPTNHPVMPQPPCTQSSSTKRKPLPCPLLTVRFQISNVNQNREILFCLRTSGLEGAQKVFEEGQGGR